LGYNTMEQALQKTYGTNANTFLKLYKTLQTANFQSANLGQLTNYQKQITTAIGALNKQIGTIEDEKIKTPLTDYVSLLNMYLEQIEQSIGEKQIEQQEAIARKKEAEKKQTELQQKQLNYLGIIADSTQETAENTKPKPSINQDFLAAFLRSSKSLTFGIS